MIAVNWQTANAASCLAHRPVDPPPRAAECVLSAPLWAADWSSGLARPHLSADATSSLASAAAGVRGGCANSGPEGAVCTVCRQRHCGWGPRSFVVSAFGFPLGWLGRFRASTAQHSAAQTGQGVNTWNGNRSPPCAALLTRPEPDHATHTPLETNSPNRCRCRYAKRTVNHK